MAVRTNTSKKGWDEVCQGIPTGGEWDLQDQQLHINVLQVKTVKLALLAYHKQFQMKPILSDLVKLEGIKNNLMESTKEIGSISYIMGLQLQENISMNAQADWQ